MLLAFAAFTISAALFPVIFVHGQTDDDIWKIYDVIEPRLEEVRWSETGTIGSPASWISDGTWIVASMRQSLVSSNDIFVSLYERFDWSQVRPIAESYYGTSLFSFEDFAQAVQDDASPWISMGWQMDTAWFGISQNTTKVEATYNQTSGYVDLSTWFHITRVPEYLSGSEKLTNWLTGFDLTSISIGNMKLWELYEDWSMSGTAYRLQLIAPANILSQHGDNYTCNIGVANSAVHKSFWVDQVIDINMPANTVTKELSPAFLSVNLGNNVGSFVLEHGDVYPTTFSVMSSPPTKDAFAEAVTAWFTTPGGLAAIASLIVLTFTALRGRRVYSRSALYHRLYRSMVTLYDLYSKDEARFHSEIDAVSKTIFKTMVDNKITDDQFEKLLRRRDDLLARAEKKAPPPPKP